jgi:hypothetical protein
VVYSVHVFGDGPELAAGCGTPGQKVAFKVDSQAMEPIAAWNNERVWQLDLRHSEKRIIYLPLIMRQG